MTKVMTNVQDNTNIKSVSVIVPGLNEAGNIEKAVLVIVAALEKQKITDYEIIMIDDGSTDGMNKIVDRMATENSRFRAFHNQTPKGLGCAFRTGVSLAAKEYVGWFPGDNENLPESMKNIFEQIGKADAIIPYTFNPWVRPLYRRLLSAVYTATFNTLFGLNL
ncbi:MAG: glycosyltransferase family 2 protein, partial [Candidatus Taylorbacteria bacterium]|nr:glycosyltransferase family 2 protein [Candidatus Taylorbacteria bacterium]